MGSVIIAHVHAVWNTLPALTLALRFGTALAGFIGAVSMLTRRVRRVRRSRRRRG